MAVMVFLVLVAGCNKNDFLNEKPQQSQVVPTTLQDFQAILDNDNVMNGALNMGVVPTLGEIGTTDYYLADSNFRGHLSIQEQNEYIWAVNPYPGTDVTDWDLPYIAVLYANEVITGITGMKVAASDQPEWNNLMGSALFYRSFFFYNLAQIFAPPYREGETQLGIPLRLTADVNEKLVRASLADTYTRIITDLKTSTSLLPITALYGTRPCRPAAYALLARIYLVLGDYTDALSYADSCLSLNNTLIDYNTLDTTSSLPIARFNAENLFNCVLIRSAPFLYGRVDGNLYASYTPNKDLRPGAWFKGNPARLKCSYDGSFNPYGGIATDEVYLIRAECSARLGNAKGAIGDLNTLLVNRFAAGTFQALSDTSADAALTSVLAERRRELIFRGLRWPDLRRLGSDAERADTLYRFVLGQPYTLLPDDLRYTYPIPDNVLGFNPGMVQNPR